LKTTNFGGQLLPSWAPVTSAWINNLECGNENHPVTAFVYLE